MVSGDVGKGPKSTGQAPAALPNGSNQSGVRAAALSSAGLNSSGVLQNAFKSPSERFRRNLQK